MARVDYDRQSAVYDEGRGFSPDDYEEWRRALVRYMPPGSLVLDLGSGTGRWSTTLSSWFDIRLIGIEPSAGMRRKAAAKERDAFVSYVGGRAEEIPLRAECVDAAWLAHVIHHFDDLAAAARELRRVVKPGRHVLMRQAFSDRLTGISLFRFFPAAATIAGTFPTLSETLEILSGAGFDHVLVESHEQQTAPDLASTIEKVKLRADTTLELISDEDFEEGLENLIRAAEVEHGPVMDRLDLLIAS